MVNEAELSSAQLYKDANELMLNDEFEKALKVDWFLHLFNFYLDKVVHISKLRFTGISLSTKANNSNCFANFIIWSRLFFVNFIYFRKDD